MDKKDIYEGLFDGRGTPIRCRSLDEVVALISDIKQLFPKQHRRLDEIVKIYGNGRYETEIVFRFARHDVCDHISINFCNEQFYRNEGYDIIEFSDLMELNKPDSEEETAAFAESFRNLFL